MVIVAMAGGAPVAGQTVRSSPAPIDPGWLSGCARRQMVRQTEAIGAGAGVYNAQPDVAIVPAL
jgi:hypothetical protein